MYGCASSYTRGSGIGDRQPLELRSVARRLGEIVGRLADTAWLGRDPRSGVAQIAGRHRLPSDVVGELMDDLAFDDVRVIVCDLNEMAVSHRTMREVFAPVADYLAAWPGALVVACVSDPWRHAALLPAAIPGRLLVHRFVEDGVGEARGLTEPLEQAGTHLAPVASAPATGREFVRRTLRDWQLVDLAWPASLVTSELVTNSMRHCSSVVDLTLSHVRTLLRIAVHDHGGGVPAVRAATEAEAMSSISGRGLQLIEALSQVWGVFPNRPRGKTVWALLETPETPGLRTAGSGWVAAVGAARMQRGT